MNKISYEIEQDDLCESPRECDNLGKMHCWHHRYELGDVQHYEDTGKEFYYELGGLERDSTWSVKEYEIHRNAALKRADHNYIILPLYLYDHSGITMNTTGFSGECDSGQVGYIIASIEEIKKRFKWKVLTKTRRAAIIVRLKDEVDEYDMYLRGFDAWFYTIRDENGETLESCGGFFDRDNCEREAKMALRHHINKI